MLGKASYSCKNSRLISRNWFASWTILLYIFWAVYYSYHECLFLVTAFLSVFRADCRVFSSRYKNVFIICTITNSDLMQTPWNAIMLLFHCLNCPWKTQCFNTNTRSHLNSDNVVSVTLQLEKANPTYSYHGRRRSLPLSRTKVVSVVT